MLPEVTITGAGGTLRVGQSAGDQADGFCSMFGGFCLADGRMDFASAVANLRFDVDGAGRGDSVFITALNGATSVGSVTAIFNGHLDFSSLGDITSLVFDDSSTNGGVACSTFVYDAAVVVPPPNGVPEPGSVALLGLGLAGIAAMRKRRQARSASRHANPASAGVDVCGCGQQLHSAPLRSSARVLRYELCPPGVQSVENVYRP